MDPVFTSSSRYQFLVLVLKMMKRTMLVAVFLMLSTKLIAASSSSSCHPGDRDALLAMKAALGNPKQLASWTPDSSCCDHWRHIECDDSTGRVISLSIFQDDGSLAGTIPDAIAGLDHLENLALRHLPALSGAIPPAIAKLSKLVFLTISRTAVSGPVPSFLGDLTALTELDLSFNSLSGSIPASLADLPNLMSIDIRHNRLTGSLPPLLFSKQAPPPPPQDEQEDDDEEEAYYDLINLRLSHNGLSGSIPSEWSTVKFGMVSLSRNAFAGDAAALFGRDKPLQLLDLSRNGFSFNLSAVELPEQLSIMDVSHNAIYGRVPEQAANLQSFNVSYNLLCGEVPGGMASLFDAYCFQHNSCLCGAPLGACRQPYH